MHSDKSSKNMLIYNTTYHVPIEDARNFVIWIHQAYIPQALQSGLLSAPRLCHILSHHDETSECFSLQFETEGTDKLHEWYVHSGVDLEKELKKTFKEKVVGFTTLMDVIEEE